MERKRVLCAVNLPQRDRLKNEILATHLRGRGFEVRVVDFLPRHREHILYWKPDVIVIPEARCEYTCKLCETLMSWDVITVILRTEPGCSKGAWEKMEWAEKQTVISAWPYSCDMELVWSQDFGDILAENGHIGSDKIVVIGGTPFDIYFREPRPKIEGRKNLLFATGWGHADRSREYNVPEAPPGSPVHWQAFDRHNKGRAAWISMMNKMVKALDPLGWKFFHSVKTGEMPGAYQGKLDPKITLIMPTPTYILLQNSDLVIHPGSTFGLGAHFSGVPGFSFCGNLNQTVGYEYPHIHPDFEDEDKLIEAVKEFVGSPENLGKSNADLMNVKRLENEFYGTIDGKALERAATAIATYVNSVPKVSNIPDIWPVQNLNLHTPGVSKTLVQWVCEICHQNAFTFDMRTMIKCPHCGISLARVGMPIEQKGVGQNVLQQHQPLNVPAPNR